MGGIILGAGVGRLRDLWDRVFRTRTQIETALGLNCLAIVPLIRGRKPRRRARADGNRGEKLVEHAGGLLKSLAHKVTGATPSERVIAPKHNLLWQVVDFPLSAFAESIRAIKLAADTAGAGKSKVIGITSSLPNEGKSTIAAALAQLVAHSSGRVILVDGDLRARELSRILAPGAKAGLLEVAAGKASLDEVIWTDRTTNLSFLPTVAKSRLIHTAELLGSDATKEVFDTLRKTYDHIIVDLSPLVPIVDVRVTRGLVDSYVFVIEWGRTKTDAVERALKDVAGIYENILGAVLNKADTTALSRYEAYGYYKSNYYQRYGYTQ
jgi:succinoglycan biosynthesis transport protein ExoP